MVSEEKPQTGVSESLALKQTSRPGTLRKLAVILLKTLRSLVFLGSILTFILFWWSFIGIILGFLFYRFSKSPTWKVHGMILAFFAGLTTLLIETISVWWVLFGVGFMLFYGFIAFVYGAIGWIRRQFGGRPLLKLTEWGRRIPGKGLKAIKYAAIFTPILLWSLGSLDFGVMFDNNPQLLWINGPSMVNCGDEFMLMVQAWDRYERVSANYRGFVQFAIKSYNLTTYAEITSPEVMLPSPYQFSGQPLSQGFVPAYQLADGKDNGRHRFPVRINTTGIHYILVNDSVTGNTYWSNPILVKNFAQTDKSLYWGDLHGHTILSDGSGLPDHSFDYARFVAELDYCAVTDHGEDLSMAGLSNWLFGVVEDTANLKYVPGEFVTFQGVEWTTHYPPSISSDFGHYTVIVNGAVMPRLASNYQLDPNALWNFLDTFCNQTGSQALAIPHHTIRNQFIQDWAYINPTYVKLAEVSSVHGECLYDGYDPRNYRGSVDLPPYPVNGAAIIDAFKMGFKMALCSSGDNHDGHPGHSISHTDAYIGHQWPFAIDHARNGHPYPSGLTAVYADNLTRAGIWDALENQRVFANSDYGRPILNFTINGVQMGSGSTVYVATNTTQRNISIFFAQDGSPPARVRCGASVTANWIPNWTVTVEIIKNGIIWNTSLHSSPVFRLDLSDTDVITGTSYSACIEQDGNYYINQFSEKPVDPASLNTGGLDFYLVRVLGANGRTTYAGPIWVEALS
ncbi:MAG: DUF3604 domain-containing protein [Candidatus Helarchaeota archaeon]